ncbi:ABC transporter substrate-binding protein [Coprobacter sp.]
MKNKILGSIILLFLLISCNRKGNAISGNDADTSSYQINYAEMFNVNRCSGYTEVQVRDPWDTTRLLQSYILVPKAVQLPSSLPEGTVVRTPVTRVAVYSSVHCSMLEQLGNLSDIAGVCESRYIMIPEIKAGVSMGKIADLGESYAPDVEKIIDLSPEVIISSPFQNMSYGKVEKLEIPIIEGVDYMESTPLGRAEWIRFLGLFFDKEALSDSIFGETEASYLALKEKAANVTKRPTVVSEMKTGPVWYVPGGNSYMARLFADAGADYFWKNVPQTGSLSLSFEAVFDKAHQADFWLIKYNRDKEMTLTDLKKDYAANANFEAFKNGNVWGSNSAKVPFYEEVPLHPDYLLQDFIRIFHPDLLPGDTLRYFKLLK